MDEPTNHLDFLSVNILIQALQQFEGTFVVVSHDRHFVSQIANKIWYIEDHQIKEYPGTYDEYVDWQENRKVVAPSQKAQPQKVEKKAKEGKKKTPDQAAINALKKLQKELDGVESEIEKLEAKKPKLEAEMADPAIFSDFNKLQEKQNTYDALEKQLTEAQEKWEELAERIDELS